MRLGLGVYAVHLSGRGAEARDRGTRTEAQGQLKAHRLEAGATAGQSGALHYGSPPVPRCEVPARRGSPIPDPLRGSPAIPALPLLRAEHLSRERGLPPLCERELSPDDAARALAELDAAFVRGCTACGLAAHRTQTVFGAGHPRAELAFVGEGPGADEDAQGLPFVGKAGQLLTKMIAAMTLTREQVYICNTVKCRPPGNRTPVDDEIAACAPYLLRQLAIVRPKVIVALGRPASQTLLATGTSISSLRGNWFEFPPAGFVGDAAIPRCRLMPTFHPSYLLRVPQEKGKAWADLQMVMRELGLEPRRPAA